MYILDRIEEQQYAVLEHYDTGKTITVPLSQLPSTCKEGDCFHKSASCFIYDEALTKNRREYIHNLAKGLWE